MNETKIFYIETCSFMMSKRTTSIRFDMILYYVSELKSTNKYQLINWPKIVYLEVFGLFH